jgi:cell division protein FtsB
LLLLIFFVFILILTFFFGDGGIIEIIQAQHKIEGLEKNIEKLKTEKKKLTREIHELETDPWAFERRAREKLWLMKPNEKVMVIVRKDKDNSH